MTRTFSIKNYKSIVDQTIELGRVNVFIGGRLPDLAEHPPIDAARRRRPPEHHQHRRVVASFVEEYFPDGTLAEHTAGTPASRISSQGC